jgi:hypothetical protein
MNIKNIISSFGILGTIIFSWCSESTNDEINNNKNIVWWLLNWNENIEKNNILTKKIENITKQLNSPFRIKTEDLKDWTIYYNFKKENNTGSWVLSIYFYWTESSNINLFYINKDWIKIELKHWYFWPQWENWTMIWWYYYFKSADSSWNIKIWVELKSNHTDSNNYISNLNWNWVIMHYTEWLTNNSNSSIPNINISKDEVITIKSKKNSFYYISPQKNYDIKSINWWQFSINEYQLIWDYYYWKGWILRIPKGTNITIIKK